MVSGQMASTNWAGYVVHSSNVTAISASWTVPEVQCANTAATNTISHGEAVWIGFDGLGINWIPEQLGSLSYCFNGSPNYWAWEQDQTHGSSHTGHATTAFEDTFAGDHMTAYISYLGKNTFRLSIADARTGANRTYTAMIPNAPRASAEWIVEVPYNLNTGQQLKLAKFQPVNFTDCGVAVNNVAGSITQNNAQTLNMVDNTGNIIAAPQDLNQAGTSFQVAEVG